jgi:hypothetical protein
MNSTTEKHPGGPRTEAGKTRSSRNALSHGILSQRIFLLQNEDPKEWQKLQEICARKFKPADDYEARIVQNIAYAEWRLQRLYAMENAAIDIEMLRQDAEFEKQYNGTADEFMRNAPPSKPQTSAPTLYRSCSATRLASLATSASSPNRSSTSANRSASSSATTRNYETKPSRTPNPSAQQRDQSHRKPLRKCVRNGLFHRRLKPTPTPTSRPNHQPSPSRIMPRSL